MLFRPNRTSLPLSVLGALSVGASGAVASEKPPVPVESSPHTMAGWPDLLSNYHQGFRIPGLLDGLSLPPRQVIVMGRHPEFAVPPVIKERADYWFEVLTTTRNVTFISHREYPWVEFARIDFSAMRDTLSDREYGSRRHAAIKRQTEEIRAAMKYLGSGAPPRSPLETRIHENMQAIAGGAERFRRVATNPGSILVQSGIREGMQEGLVRMGMYLPHFEEILVQKYGLPRELLAVALLESAMNPAAISWQGAAGPWQFMPGTAKDYKLSFSPVKKKTMPPDYDERRDFILATEAASKKLGAAYIEFGSWPVAITSYHRGVKGTWDKVAECESLDYEKLVGVLEFYSGNYLSEVLAALEIIERQQALFPGLTPAEPIQFVSYPLAKKLAAPAVMKSTGVDSLTLATLNPALGRPYWEGKKLIPDGYVLRVPPEVDLALLGELERQERRSVVVKQGQTLSVIARTTGVSVAELKKVNGLSSDRIRAGHQLFLE